MIKSMLDRIEANGRENLAQLVEVGREIQSRYEWLLSFAESAHQSDFAIMKCHTVPAESRTAGRQAVIPTWGFVGKEFPESSTTPTFAEVSCV